MPSAIHQLRISIVTLVALAAAGCATTQPSATTQAPTASPQTGTAAGPSTPLSPPSYKSEFGTMWTFDAPPLDYWKRTYNFSPDQRWLDRVRLAAVRLPNCSASFVSANGLVLTNHHCARQCTEDISPKDTNYIETGFTARSLSDEKKCPRLYVDQLISNENVTDKVRAGITGSTAAEQDAQRTATIARLQSECGQATGLTCQVVTLYQGGMYSLYRYKRFSDVRMVMVPEESIGAFGGDPDNFTYPRYDLDMALHRVYENNVPYRPADYLRWSANGAAEGEAVFVIGNPGSTGRLNTLAQMEFLRDIGYPAQLAGFKRALAIYRDLIARDTAAARMYQNQIFGIENSFKAVTGYRTGLVDSTRMAQKRAFETEFRARVNADPALRARYGSAWDAVSAAQRELAGFNPQFRFYGFGPNVNLAGSTLLSMAAQIVRVASESAKPDAQRLALYRGPNLEALKQQLVGPRQINPALEKASLAAQLRAAQHELPANDPFLVAALGGRTPEAVAEALVSGTRLTDQAARRALVDGGAAAVAASTDPMIVFARTIDPLNRRIAARADSLNAIITSNAELIGQALFATYGTALPPDATFTLRISDGVVKGYPLNGTLAPYKTTFFGLYERSAAFDHKPPFHMPKRWTDRRDRLNLATGYNFVSTNDIIGGNSGSPVINRNAEIVGLVFDANIEGIANRFLFTTDMPRTVSVHSAGMVEALRKMYDAARIADELQGRVSAIR
ncbi:MAG: S46 family peptidase [Gemmatimonadota bacterium]|nr:S46 family peptidase [Gemmatimonadota bacterium]